MTVFEEFPTQKNVHNLSIGGTRCVQSKISSKVAAGQKTQHLRRIEVQRDWSLR